MMPMSKKWGRAVGWAAVAALGAGLVSSVVSAQQRGATVTAYGFELSCDANVSEGSTLVCTLSNTSDEAADWPTVGIVHLSSDDDRALVVGSPVDVAFGALEGAPETEDDVWWIGDVLVGYSRFDWDGQATASSESETTDSRTVNIVVADDTAWETAESFYVALAPSGARGVGFLYDHRHKVTIRQSDSKSSDATLASLAISAGGTTTDLTPPPSSHSLTAEYTTTELTVAPTATYKPSGISVAVDSGAAYSFAAETGDETRAIPLAEGINTISVTVTAENGTSSQTYEVMVKRVSLVDGATVTASSDGFSLTCPGTVAEGSTMECTLTNLSTSPADWPVVAFLHSSADVSRALIAEDPIIPESSLLYSQDIRLRDPQVAVVDNYNYGYGELFSGGSRSVYATYGYEKFDWLGTAEASASRIVFVEVLADDLDEGDEVFYAAIADSAYTGLSNLVDNKVPIVVRGTSSNSAPTFPDTETGQRSVVEGAIAGRSVGAPISATDPDGDTLVYSLQTGGDVFDIHAETGQLLTKLDAELDYETATTHSVVVAVSDGKDTAGESDAAVDATVEVTVSVIDANEPPALSGPSAVEFVEGGDDSVGAYAALDPDGDEVSWSVGGADAASFEISAEGVLRFLSPPDFDAPGDADGDNAYQVQVRVTDGKDTAGESDAAVDATVEVTVSVIDANEPPALSGPSAVEFVEGGDDSVGAYAALDPDGDEVSWSVGGADAASFEISAEGVLRFLSPPDFDAPGDADGDNAYQVQVRVTDGKDTAGESDAAVDATVEVTVSVIDANEPPALSGPSAVEFVEGGDDSVGAYAALDPDGDEVSWSVGGADAASFEISAEGVLRFLSPPDFDAPGDADGDNAYQVQVRVTDGKDTAGESDAAVDATVEVTVSVIDANEPPALSGPSAVEFVEGGDDSVGAYAALDPDGDEVSWSVGGADAASFEISAEGVLRFLSPPDFDAPGDADGDNAYQVQVRVTDGKDTAGESDAAVDATVEVTVSVIDANEPPALSGPSAVEFVEGGDDSVGAYAALDPDGDEVSWSVGGADAASFEISAEGVLRFLSPPDFDAPGDADGDNAYQVQVRVTDGKDTAGESDAAVDATVEVTVSVIDANEPPALSGPSAVEFVEGGDDSVGAYAALDPDGDEVSWSVGGADAASFEISAEGVLRFLSPPDFDAPGDADGDNAYQVQVRVTDGKDTAGESDAAVDATVEVTVSVIDANEPPALSGPSAVEFVEGGDDSVGAYAALDPDGDEVSWSVGGADAASFEISAEGVLRFLSPPDFDAPGDADGDNAYQVQVRVTDGKDTAGESDAAVDATVEVTVSVIDANEPPALSGPSAVEFVEGGDDSVGAYAALDPDGDEVSWSVGGADAASFEISAEGVLRFLSPPDFDAPGDADGDNAYQVQVRVTDGKDTAGESDAAVDATVEVTVSVIDANEPPALSGPSAVEFVEGGDDSVGAYAALDPDGDEVSWSVGGADAASFEISAEGVLRFLSPPDFDAPGDADGDNAYQVQVRVTDGKDTAGESDAAVDATVEVTVSVIDANEPPTRWSVVADQRRRRRAYRFGDGSPIEDNDTAVWSVTAGPAKVVEGAVSTVTVSVDKEFEVDQTITLAVGGTAASGDYSLSSSSLTLAAGDMSVTATVTAVDDSVIEGGDETVVVTASHGGGAVGSATVTIEDNDTPTWSVVAGPARVAEGAASTVTVSVDKEFEVDQTITLAVGGTAASGDYSLSSSSLTLDAGDTSVTATVTAVDDSDEESDETVVVTASHGGGAVGSATVTIEANDTPVSTDAALSSLALSGVSIGDFDAGITAYAASVGNGVSSTTVTAVASDDGASVVIADGDGETQGTSRSVSLVVGDNEITVTVTAEDAATTKTYTVTVARAEPAVAPLPPGVVWGDRLPDRDIALPGASSSSGVWSDGTDVWVVTDTAAGKISVYSLADGAEHTDRGFTLPGGAEYAAGLWSDGATLWVADVNSGSVRAYRLSDGARQADRDLDTAGNGEPAGIWSDGTTMWVADFTDSRVYAYDLTTKARVADKELDLDKNPGETYNPFGIWSNADTLLAASWFGGEIIAHSLADGQRQPAKDLSTYASRTNFPNGIWSNGHILWVVDASAATLYAYAVPGLGTPPNDTPVWSVTAVPARVVEGAVSTVTVSVGKEFEVDQTITLAVGGTAASGDYSLSSSSLTLDAGDMSVTASVTAVDDSVIEGGDETVVVTASRRRRGRFGDGHHRRQRHGGVVGDGGAGEGR